MKKTRAVHRILPPGELEDILRDYESRHGMTSEEFYVKYNRGELGDAEEWVAWAGYFLMAARSGLRKKAVA